MHARARSALPAAARLRPFRATRGRRGTRGAARALQPGRVEARCSPRLAAARGRGSNHERNEGNGTHDGELAKNLADTQTALNIVWTMVAGFLVMFMQAGFALVETGLTRAKNVAHTMGMNFLVYAIGIIGFYFVGFGLQMGGVGALATFGGDRRSRRSSSSTSSGRTSASSA